MNKQLLLRFEGPLMSFGGPVVDNYGVTNRYPSLSMITGLIGNALGYDHRETDKLQNLQNGLEYAVRCDIAGPIVKDYQTVDLGLQYMSDSNAWTTRGEIEKRAGGNSSETHIRFREYIADSVYTLAVGLKESYSRLTLEDLKSALTCPARPLFIGRKCCIPSVDVFLGECFAKTPIAALREWPRSERDEHCKKLEVWWFGDKDPETSKDVIQLSGFDERDWVNQIHCGRRRVWYGHIDPPKAGDHEKE